MYKLSDWALNAELQIFFVKHACTCTAAHRGAKVCGGGGGVGVVATLPAFGVGVVATLPAFWKGGLKF